jgi:GNAT superfamily N-acetyltransferase
MSVTEFDREPQVLVEHLTSYLGAWTTKRKTLEVKGCERRSLPGWDGAIRPFVGVVDQQGFGVLSVEVSLAERVRDALTGIDRYSREALGVLPQALGLTDRKLFEGVFRYCFSPTHFEHQGQWFDVSNDVVPEWLHPFGGEALLAVSDRGSYLAGVGIKRHDDFGRELAVVTDEAARGRGLARALVSQATERVLETGRAPTYLHAPGNVASARVAEAVGFVDRGWKILGIA